MPFGTMVYVNVSPASGSVVERLPMTVPIGRFSATRALDTAMSVGARPALIDVPSGTVVALITVAAPFEATLIVAPAATDAPPVSISRTVSPPGVPEKLASGTNRSLSATRRLIAAESERPDVGTLVHDVPPSVEYCHEPCRMVAALAVIAMPARLAAWPRRSSVNGLAKPTTPACSLDVTALESPPTNAEPHVTTEPSALSAAKAPLVAKMSTTPEAT